jgi:hypothetical protein
MATDSHNGEYTLARAEKLIAGAAWSGFKYRTHKPYRRHAAVTPLELRGAHRMLTSARKYLFDGKMTACVGTFAAYQVLTDALMNVTRALETL